jgi:hypothetical protein
MEGEVTLIITHSDPDLDAVGFVYSAKKRFGQEVPVEYRSPCKEEMEDPKVVVGDIGLPGHPELGYRPELNNFDHHYGCAKNSATFLFNLKYPVLRKDIVDYIDSVDLGGKRDKGEINLKVIVAGIRVKHENADSKIGDEGCRVLRLLEEKGLRPDDLSGELPGELQDYARVGLEELRKIEAEVEKALILKTNKGRQLGYVQTSSNVFSRVRETLFTKNPELEIALIYNPSRKRYSIGSNTTRATWVNLLRLKEVLNQTEWNKGLPQDQKWGGHEDRIGSPKPSGSLLSPEEVIKILKKEF